VNEHIDLYIDRTSAAVKNSTHVHEEWTHLAADQTVATKWRRATTEAIRAIATFRTIPLRRPETHWYLGVRTAAAAAVGCYSFKRHISSINHFQLPCHTPHSTVSRLAHLIF